MQRDLSITRKTTTDYTLFLTGEELVAILRGREDLGVSIPENAKVSFRVPGGGDWSNTTLEIDSDCPIKIRWTDLTSE